MDVVLLRRIVRDKLRDRETYWIAGIVGTLINGYGQLLVPWLRYDVNPFAAVVDEFRAGPGLLIFTIVLAYLFPMFVGVISSVMTRYKNRRIESVADFPERKPDPVFRAALDGTLVEVGATTRALFREHNIETAQMAVGESAWLDIAAARVPGGGKIIRFGEEARPYVVSYAPTERGHVNVYMTALPSDGLTTLQR